jgi:hypothetical protein
MQDGPIARGRVPELANQSGSPASALRRGLQIEGTWRYTTDVNKSFHRVFTRQIELTHPLVGFSAAADND